VQSKKTARTTIPAASFGEIARIYVYSRTKHRNDSIARIDWACVRQEHAEEVPAAAGDGAGGRTTNRSP